MPTRVNFPWVLEDMYFPQTTGNPKIFKNGELIKRNFKNFTITRTIYHIKLADI